MLKITESAGSAGATTLYLEGQLFGPWLSELKNSCEQILATGRRLILDLTDVSFVDREALAVFSDLTGDVEFVNCSPFVAEQLKSIRSCVQGQFESHSPEAR